MVAKIHPEPEGKKEAEKIEGKEEKKDEEKEPDKAEKTENKEGQEVKAESPTEFINVGTLEPNPGPVEPKSPSKPRQKGIGLENLRGCEYLQIRQTNRHMEDFANVQNNYDVEKSDKPQDKIFFGMECTAPEVRARVQSSTNFSQPFALKLIDRDDGSEIMEIDRKGLNDVPALLYKIRFRKREPVGAVILRFGWRHLTPTLNIFDHNGNPLMRCVGPAAARSLGKVLYAKETTFAIYKGDKEEVRVGSIVLDGDIFQEFKEPTNQEEIIKINFEDKSLDDLSRALILCTAFVLDYTQFKPPSNLQKIGGLLCFKCS